MFGDPTKTVKSILIQDYLDSGCKLVEDSVKEEGLSHLLFASDNGAIKVPYQQIFNHGIETQYIKLAD